MICRIGAVARCGRVITPVADVEPPAVAAAVRADDSTTSDRIAVSCPSPTPLHAFVGCIHDRMGLRPRTALAAAARTRGMNTPYDDELQEKREALRKQQTESLSLETHRERVASTATERDHERIRIAELRGRLREREEQGEETEALRSQLDSALQELTEAETSAIAATQQYTSAREHLRDLRDRRERTFRLEEEVANLERQARSHLVERLHEPYRTALAELPKPNTHTKADDLRHERQNQENEFDTDVVSMGLAIARLGELSAPVVLAVDRFESADEASEWLDCAVIYL